MGRPGHSETDRRERAMNDTQQRPGSRCAMNDCNYFRRSIAHRWAPGWLALLTATVLAPVEAFAASEISERVALGSFRGPHAARVRDAVEGALLRRYFLVPESMVTEAARQSGGVLRS